MLKFLIQTVDGQIKHDFTFGLMRSIEYHEWKDNEIIYITDNDYQFEFVDDNPLLTSTNESNVYLREYYKDFCPVGTVEFVSNFIKFVYGEKYIPYPINIPYCLLDNKYTFRNVEYQLNLHTYCDKLIDNEYFVKSTNKIKANINGSYKPSEIKLLPNDLYFISSIVDIDSEYRCFVYQNDLVGIQNYTRDFTLYPNVDTINEMIDVYGKNDAPIAYTLDVGVNDKGTFVMEVHDFFSCGLYGFNNLGKYQYMLYRWFMEYLRKNNLK